MYNFTVALITLGCKVNQSETQGIAEAFASNGFTVTDPRHKADVYVINSCSVTNMSESKGRQVISRLHRQNPEAVIAVTGCYAQRDPEAVRALPGVSLVVGTNHKSKIVDLCKQALENKLLRKILVTHPDTHTEFEDIPISSHAEHTRAYMKIQDGCRSFCSYCIIPHLRGVLRSRSMESIVKEAKRLAQNGFSEIVLGGIHLTSYGVDINLDLADVLLELEKTDGIKRIRLGSLEPMGITDSFLEKTGRCTKLCDHFHLSLQSGCDTVLKRMNRKYTTQQYYEVLLKLRKKYPNAAISTDIIVGFPGETDEEFEQTCRFVKKAGFALVHVFPYSKRNGTAAATMPDQISPEIKKLRHGILSDICAKQKQEYLNRFINTDVTVLIERTSQNKSRGLTSNHAEVLIDGALTPGRLYNAHVKSSNGKALYAVLTEK